MLQVKWSLQVRVEAIHTVQKLAHVGGHEMVLQMVAWQDPQAIAIKAFYEPDLHVNFCGKLATDPIVQASRLGNIHPWLFSGFQPVHFWTLSHCGVHHHF